MTFFVMKKHSHHNKKEIIRRLISKEKNPLAGKI